MRTDKNTMKWGKNTIKTAKYDETEENDEYVKKQRKTGIFISCSPNARIRYIGAENSAP